MPKVRVAGILAFRGHRVLLVRNRPEAAFRPGSYGIPAGHDEGRETDIHTAIREMREETGYTVSPEFLVRLPRIYAARVRGEDIELQVYLCRRHEGLLKSSSEGEAHWVEISALPTLPLLPNVEEIVADGQELISQLS